MHNLHPASNCAHEQGLSLCWVHVYGAVHGAYFSIVLPEDPDDSDRPEAGREIIDDNYPHTDMSEESRELDQYLTNIQHRAHVNSDNDIKESEQNDAFVNIQEGGQDDPMFDYERVQEPKKQQHTENTNDSIITESEESSSRSDEDSSDSEQDEKVSRRRDKVRL